MSKKNRNKTPSLTGAGDPPEEELDQDLEGDEVQPEVPLVAKIVETKSESLARRIREATAKLQESADRSSASRELYMELQADYDAKFEALQKERQDVSQAHQDYIDASDAHARVQGELAKLNAELASQ